MRRLLFPFFLLAAVLPLRAAENITVDQLERRVAGNQNRSDKDMAHRLGNLELTHRLSTTRLQRLQAAMPGPASHNALIAMADLSAVLDLPSGEIPPDPPPTAPEQQQILARAIEASENSPADSLPDFDATANTTRFRNLKYLSTNSSMPVPLVLPVPLMLSRATDVVTYREGRAIITPTTVSWASEDSVKAGVERWDGVYTVLGNVLRDLRAAQPQWAHWEQGPTGKMAVFRFSAPKDHANFPVRTFGEPYPRRGFKGSPGYHAEVVLDPATGAVHRFVLRAALDPGQNVSRVDVAVEFDSVHVDGKSFLCPSRSITIGVAQSLLGNYNLNYSDFDIHSSQDIRPLMHLVDVEFTAYQPGVSKPPAAPNLAFLAEAIQVTGERVSVAQLEKIVSDLGGGNDSGAAQRLGQLDLAQRLTADRYATMRNRLPGKASADALLALYDLSAFADLPPANLADGPAPDAATQGKIVTSAVEFVAGVTHKMPDLFATRQLSRFEDLHVVRGVPQPHQANVKPLVMVDQSTGSVHFREGREVVESASRNSQATSPRGLDTWGTFGPILEIVMADVLKARIGWGHWEHGPSARLAVFRYAVPVAASHYDVRFCCYLGQDGLPSSFSATPGYHGELAIDPKTGAVLRLVLKADLRPDPAPQFQQELSPLLRSDVLVEYGEVDIAGKQYTCPTRTVSIMTSWTLGSQGPLKKPVSMNQGVKAVNNALALLEFSRVNAINEAVFRNYHVFRSEMRIVNEPAEPGALPPTP